MLCEPFRERGLESYPGGGGVAVILAKIGVGGFAPFVYLVLPFFADPFLPLSPGDEFGENLRDVGVVEMVDILSFRSWYSLRLVDSQSVCEGRKTRHEITLGNCKNEVVTSDYLRAFVRLDVNGVLLSFLYRLMTSCLMST